MSDTPTNENIPTEPAAPPVQYLLAQLAGQQYGVRLDNLQEVIRFNQDAVAPVPNAGVEWLEGIISLRGTIVSVLNLRLFLGLARTEAAGLEARFDLDLGIGFGRAIPRLLVVYEGDLAVGVIVDDIKGVTFVQPDAITAVASPESYGPVAPYLAGQYQEPESDQPLPLLDLRRLITSPEVLRFEPQTV